MQQSCSRPCPVTEVRVVSIGVGEYPISRLSCTGVFAKWASKLPTIEVPCRRRSEINTQSMDQLRKALFREVPTIRINNKYTQPEMATDMLEADLEKLSFALAARA